MAALPFFDLIAKNGDIKSVEAILQGNYDAIPILGNYRAINFFTKSNNLQYLLFKCCEYGEKEIVGRLLQHKVNVNTRQENDKTALICASEAGHESIVRALISSPSINIDARDSTRSSAFIYACRRNRKEIVKLLIDEGCDINSFDSEGMNGLMHACEWGLEDCVKYILQSGRAIVDNEGHMTPLSIVCRDEVYEVLLLLLDHGVNVRSTNLRDTNDHHIEGTALLQTCRKGYCSLARLLIEAGSDINAVDSVNNTALLYATYKNDIPLVKDLLEYKHLNVNATDSKGQSALMHCCFAKYNELFTVLVEHGISLNIVDNRGKTALTHACENENLEMVKLLLEKNVDVDKLCGSNKRTALILACEMGNANIVKCLVKHGANLNARDKKGKTALYYAMKNGNVDILRKLIRPEVNLNVKNEQGKTLLFSSCEIGNIELVRLLIAQSANMNLNLNARHTSTKKSAIMVACEKRHLNIVELLIRGGANVELHDDNFKSVIAYLTEMESERLLRLAIHNISYFDGSNRRNLVTPLMIAAGTGNETIVKLLLSTTVFSDLDSCDERQKTALMRACENGHSEIVLMLLEKNAQLNGRDYLGLSASDYALKGGHFEIICHLLQAGANFTIIDPKNKSLLMHACQKGSIKTVSVLLKTTIDVNAHDIDGKTALMYACEEDDEDVVSLLLTYNVDVCSRDTVDKTAFLYACERGNEGVVQLLLNHSSELKDACCKKGKNALILASENGHHKIVNLLLMHGADVDVCDNQGRTALHLSCRNGHSKCVMELLPKSSANIRTPDLKLLNPLMHACMVGFEDIVKTLLKYPHVVNVQDSFQKTALIHASVSGNSTIVEFLLDHGADQFVSDYFGNDALFYSCKFGHDKIVESLMKKRENCESHEYFGHKPLICACVHGHDKVVDVLIRHGVNVNTKDNCGKNALLYASKFGHSRVVQVLLKHNIEMEVQDERGMNALMIASVRGHESIVNLLLQNRAEVATQNHRGQTALMFASKKSFSKIVSLLLEFGSEVNVFDQFGKTAFTYGCKSWDDVRVKELLSVHSADRAMRNSNAWYPGINYKYKTGSISRLVLRELSIDAQAEDGKTAIMWAVAMKKEEFVQSLLNAGADLDLVDEKKCTVLCYALEGRGDCLKILIDSGKLLDSATGLLKRVHKDAMKMTKSNLNVTIEALRVALKSTIFLWDWCPLNMLKRLGFEALNLGFCSGYVTSPDGMLISPIIQAVLENDFLAGWELQTHDYFFPEDYATLYNMSRVLGNPVIMWRLKAMVSRRVISLEKWSILTVSRAISKSGPPCNRKQRINALAIPELLKNKFMFLTTSQHPLCAMSHIVKS